VKNRKRSQKLASGVVVRQDFHACARMVFYETGNQHWRHATHGGTAFVVVFRGRPYAFTCNHVLQDFEWRQLVITNTKFGRQIAGLQSVSCATQPHDAAAGTDINDIVVIEFASSVAATFFKDTAYILDNSTTTASQPGDQLYVAGALKEKVDIGDTITSGFCSLEFVDGGADSSDPTLRQAHAEYVNPKFSSISGLSGAPVYNASANALCGMVVRGGMQGSACTIRYFDIFDMMQLLAGVHEGLSQTFYRKRWMPLRKL
jgi:Trypsin-like peptidase domain